MQASVDQLRDENKTLREVLKSVQEQLRDAMSLLRAQPHLSIPQPTKRVRPQVPLQLRSA
jgi:hypothetical protein